MWTITEETFQPGQLHHKETLFTIGNGYLSTRGAFEESYPDDQRTTFIHGVFDDVPIYFTELANAPDWLPFEVYIHGERFSMYTGTLRDYSRTLDLKTGLLTRMVKWTSPSGKGVELTFERFTSLADEYLCCLRCRVVPDYDGEVKFILSLDGNSQNLGRSHWRWLEQGVTGKGIVYLHSQTLATKIDLALAMRSSTSLPPVHDEYTDIRDLPSRALTFAVRAGEGLAVEKYVSFATSRDSEAPLKLALEHVEKATSWEQEFKAHRRLWQADWERMDIIIEGDDEAQLAVRASLFQLLIAAPRHDDRVNIGAKTLSGFGYRGHSFWDAEIFMLPVFIYTTPHIARNLLNYRYQRLLAAHEKACQNGFEGAQFPWESADSGQEVTPRWVPDFTDQVNLVRIWTGDIEIHISADIAFATYLYWKLTADDAWFIEKGAEIILDTAKFWASRAEWDADKQHYEYNDVIGPDEFHDHVDNNFYTNYMARWNISTALEILQWLHDHDPGKTGELGTRLELTPDRLESWKAIMQRIALPSRPDGLIEQFDGYFQLKDVDLAALEPRCVSAQVLFGIEGANQTQIIKQPDVLMLLHLMRDDFSDAQVRANYDYYTPRTDLTFGSSLGPSIQAALAYRMGDCGGAYEYFTTAAGADLKDVRRNAGDGIHGASAGGIWQAVVLGFAGLHVHADRWEIHPCLPPKWKRLAFNFTFHGEIQSVDIRNP